MPLRWSGWLLLLGLFLPALATAEKSVKATESVSAPMRFIYNGPEAPDDKRYDYHWRVLRAALDTTVAEWGAYELKASEFMNESRQFHEMKRGGGNINVMVLDTTKKLEANLLPVKIPIDKGLLGYRVFLVRAADQEKFAQVRSLDDLRKFSIGQGFDWSDLDIFKAAGFRTVPGNTYEGLFAMLMVGRFDAFGRGVTEAPQELAERQKKFPGMVIEKSLLLYYPMPIYFWFSKSPEGAKQAKRVEQGMRQIIANGALDKLFNDEFGGLITALDLKRRRFFRIDNPLLPPNQPFGDSRLWFKPLN